MATNHDVAVLANGNTDTCTADGASESDSSSCYAEIGFMFEGAEPSCTLSLAFTAARPRRPGAQQVEESSGTAAAAARTVHVELTAVDGDPGALQSGHYLWPAAPAMAQFLVDSILLGCQRDVNDVAGDDDDMGDSPLSVLNESGEAESGEREGRRLELPLDRLLAVAELGAGCGLAGIAALQALTLLGRQQQRLQRLRKDQTSDTNNVGNNVPMPLVRCMAFTDHDPGTLDRARNNAAATLDKLRKLRGGDNENSISVAVESIPLLFEPLSWGDEVGAAALRKKAAECWSDKCNGTSELTFDLILGSDLIYCRDVVRPLLRTAKLLMASSLDDRSLPHSGEAALIEVRPPVFVCTQSFPYDDETEAEIDASCADLGLVRMILSDDLDKCEGCVKLQAFSPICVQFS